MHFRRSGALVAAALAGALAVSAPSRALDSDANQQATLAADEVELDLKTGVRTYRGNVRFRHGGIHLACDALVTRHGRDGELASGVCTGQPGKFNQRREGRDANARGNARRITLDKGAGLLLLEGGAEVVLADGDRIRGERITYDLKTKKVKIAGGAVANARLQPPPADAGETRGEPAESADAGAAKPDSAEPARPRLIIQPRKNRETQSQ